jgi:beta-lactamase class A
MSSFISIIRWVLRLVSLACFATSLLLLKQGVDRYKSGSDLYPAGSLIAGVPVGGLDQEQARQRLQEAYAIPLELRCAGFVFQATPTDLGFNLDLDGMLAAANQEQTAFSWQAYWNYLHGSTFAPVHTPLKSNLDAARLGAYLSTQIAPYCSVPATPAAPYPGMLDFISGQGGRSLDVEASVALIQKAGLSLDQISIDLPTSSTPPLPASIQNLEIFLKQTIRLSNFDGVAGVFLSDLQTNQQFTFVLNHGVEVDKPEAVSFTGASTIKIPIMISVMRRVPETPDAATVDRLEQMIAFSNNAASDWLMKNMLDPVRGPLKVTEDMHTLGLQDTFLAGFFALGSPLLERYTTPGNTRTDLNTDPDLYNQANPSEIGGLLKGIYQCAQQGQGELVTAFPGEITQAKCQVMLKYLKMDRMPYMIQYGLPDGTVTAHKHGWVSDAQNIIHDMSDAAIVFTPNGDYVLTVYLYKSDLLVFEDGNKLVGDLSKVVYNYFQINAKK